MGLESPSDKLRYLRQWVLSTIVGWFLGIIAVVLFAGLAEMISIGDHFTVGMGMGLGIGFMQWRIARKWFGMNSHWMWATIVGIGLPFALTDVFNTRWAETEGGLLLLVAVGALILGLWQWKILQPRSVRSHWWVAGCIVSWTLPAIGISLTMTESAGPQFGSLLNILVIVLWGGVHGLITGGMLVWILSPRISAA